MRPRDFRLFVGALVLLLGATMAAYVVFGVRFPLVPLVFAVLLIASGTRAQPRTDRYDQAG